MDDITARKAGYDASLSESQVKRTRTFDSQVQMGLYLN